MRDFTVDIYKKLIAALHSQGYTFHPFEEFITYPSPRSIVLRHDVDKRPEYSLRFAQIEKEHGIRGTYYFRIVPQSFNEKIITEIASLGHEIGYHYEDFDIAWKRFKSVGNRPQSPITSPSHVHATRNTQHLLPIAIQLFHEHLEKLRTLAPVKTICMHGSPLSSFDNRILWEHYNYRDYGIFGEPYFDLDFTKVLYLTDTGRKWDGERVNVRDKDLTTKLASRIGRDTKGAQSLPAGQAGTRRENYKIHSTMDIIRLAESGQLPDKIMITFHPQRWSDEYLPWLWELVGQMIKNGLKYWMIRLKS